MLAVHTLLEVGRLRRQLSISELARELHVNRVQLSEAIRLRRTFPPKLAERAEKALGWMRGSFALAATNEAMVFALPRPLRNALVEAMKEVFAGFLLEADGCWHVRQENGFIYDADGINALICWLGSVMNSISRREPAPFTLYPPPIVTAQGTIPFGPREDIVATFREDPQRYLLSLDDMAVVAYLPLITSLTLTDTALTIGVCHPHGAIGPEQMITIPRSTC